MKEIPEGQGRVSMIEFFTPCPLPIGLCQEAGADVFATDAGKKTIFHNAARNGRLWILAYFLWVTGEMEMEMDHRTQGEAEGCNRGENRGADSRGSASDGNGNGNPSTVTGLGGAPRMPKMRSPEEDSLLHRKDQDGHTALHWACYAGHVGIARLLVESGLDPRTKDPGGKNSLHWGATKVGSQAWDEGALGWCLIYLVSGTSGHEVDPPGPPATHLAMAPALLWHPPFGREREGFLIQY